MKLYTFILSAFLFITITQAQQNMMTPELLWKLKRLSPIGITKDGKNVIYSTTEYKVVEGEKISKKFSLPINGGSSTEIQDFSNLIFDKSISPDGTRKIDIQKVKLDKVSGSDYYPQLQNSDVKIYDDLHYRHWDTWMDGSYNHLILNLNNGSEVAGIDLLKDEPFHSPQMPFGSDEDFTWSPDGSKILYVAKKKKGKEYATSTNTDIYEYDVKSGKTKNLTDGMMGYDTHPEFSSKGILAFTSMARDGYEADKNDLIMVQNNEKINLTESWDGTVNAFKWADNGEKIYFNAPIGGTIQLFEIEIKSKKIKQITDGEFDIAGLVGQTKDAFIVTRTDINHAADLFSVDLKSGKLKQLTDVNQDIYSKIKLSKVEKRITKTTDNKDMVSWVVYPPDFDPAKKYPTLLYCQGGPQSALTQFYSYRWNLQLIAANGYIVIAPNRRGMPGHGVEWNEKISKDWGGQVMDDYLSAIDDISRESYVDKERLGAVGASYGGYSVLYLAGIHNKRFKSFISHNGVFDLKSMYGTTEEVWFPNWDAGGAYWEKDNKDAVKTYEKFDPSNMVKNWDTPILIFQGGKDYRVPIGQGQEAFQAAQLQGIKSRFIYFPDENHWVLQPQNSVIWHTEFFRWLKETL
ncbi:S9 family peptidase [Moheibacter sediminis]|uniref:Dipeptidyl aminopeptidase/acylaminoacyl peptidase n=1 Tax=Moheibacter sediminis TaxID=1434700 RepID=A0A1W2BNV1_9FLAO|nr:S9 family peptidase [Moheibacter sediminis]SMC74533.1 Dipeptidyl aminopeptidase/acylaminoacyl peptidase [Moheibacter sediminis]